jgi:heat-inducible transcriptional repressor
MNERHQKLVYAVVEEYIQTAVPVCSKLLTTKYALEVSPATVRHDMVELDALGYLHQPHTSAGRIPTEKAYKLYLEIDSANQPLDEKTEQYLENAYAEEDELDPRRKIKNTAKVLAEESKETIIIGFGKYDTYYTGVSHLFSKPEFQDADFVRDISGVIDRIDDLLAEKLFDGAGEKMRALIGSDNSFSDACSLLVIKFGQERDHFLGLLGPLRMNYRYNTTLLNFTQKLLS